MDDETVAVVKPATMTTIGNSAGFGDGALPASIILPLSRRIHQSSELYASLVGFRGAYLAKRCDALNRYARYFFPTL
ncbi:hypothetical protein Trydic_g16772 [Trypoxylus dichotomus]